MSEHHPKPPDTSSLYQDRSWGEISNNVAGRLFWITAVGAAAFMTAVILWIFL